MPLNIPVTQKDADGLKACAHCGGPATLVTPWAGSPYVCCVNNFCTGPKPTVAEAIVAWNRRAGDTP
jgi:hypothetical protein